MLADVHVCGAWAWLYEWTVIAKRVDKLNTYFSELVQITEVWRVRALVKLLDGPREILASNFASVWQHSAAKVTGRLCFDCVCVVFCSCCCCVWCCCP